LISPLKYDLPLPQFKIQTNRKGFGFYRHTYIFLYPFKKSLLNIVSQVEQIY